MNLAVLWEATRDDPKQVAARQNVIQTVKDILKQAEVWKEAELIKREATELADAAARYLEEDVDMN